MMKIQTIKISNIKAVEDFSLPANGRSVMLLGKNGTGKSTVLQTMFLALRDKISPNMLHNGAEHGTSVLELTNGDKFELQLNSAGQVLTYTDKSGARLSGFKDVVKKAATYFAAKPFDMTAFLAASALEQSKQLQQIVGIDFTELDKGEKDALKLRTESNAALKILQSKTGFIDVAVGDELVDIEATLSEIASAQSNAERLQQQTAAVLSLERDIASLRAMIAEKETALAAARLGLTAIKTVNVAELTARLNVERAANAAVISKRAFVAAAADYEKERAKNEDIAEAIAAYRAEKKLIISNSNLPEGFSFNDDGAVLYEGYPLSPDYLSTSKLGVAALKLAMLQLSDKLVKCVFFDATYMDDETFAAFVEYADNAGFQVIAECVDRSAGALRYEIVEV